MEKFKGQDNDTLKELCSEKKCEITIVQHNLTNKFQSHNQILDINVNTAAEVFIQNQCNDWFLNKVLVQLKKGIDPVDIKIT